MIMRERGTNWKNTIKVNFTSLVVALPFTIKRRTPLITTREGFPNNQAFIAR